MLSFSIPVPLAYNTWVNVVMLGEKISDMVKEDHGYKTGGPDPIANMTIPDPVGLPTGGSSKHRGSKKKSHTSKKSHKKSKH